MRFAFTMCILLSRLFLVAAPATAQEFAPAIGHTGIGRCHMDVCSLFAIEDAKPVGSTKEGALFVVAAKQWENAYKARGDNDDHEYDRPPVETGKPETAVSFVFCSKTKPVEFFFTDGKWSSSALRPGDEAAVSGAMEYAYVFYWAVCHNTIVKDPVSANMAMKLGYHFNDIPSQSFDTGTTGNNIQPFDVLR
jgi:hypothetical protein